MGLIEMSARNAFRATRDFSAAKSRRAFAICQSTETNFESFNSRRAAQHQLTPPACAHATHAEVLLPDGVIPTRTPYLSRGIATPVSSMRTRVE
jgi:hypothetical protein